MDMHIWAVKHDAPGQGCNFSPTSNFQLFPHEVYSVMEPLYKGVALSQEKNTLMIIF